MKKILAIIAAVASFSLLGASGNSHNAQNSSTANTTTVQSTAVPTAEEEATDLVYPTQRAVDTVDSGAYYEDTSEEATTDASDYAAESDYESDDYYTNVDGEEIHTPEYSDTVPADATAQCEDGTYSYSTHRRGTCSGHGGVSSWL